MKKTSLFRTLKQLKRKLFLKWILATQFKNVPRYNPRKRSHNPIAYYKYSTADHAYNFYILEVQILQDYHYMFWGFEIEYPSNTIRHHFTKLGPISMQQMHLIRQPFTPTSIMNIPEIGRPWISIKDDKKRTLKIIEYWNSIVPSDINIPDPKGQEFQDIDDYYEYFTQILKRQAINTVLKN